MTQTQEKEVVKVKRYVCPKCKVANEIAENTTGYSLWNGFLWGATRGGVIGVASVVWAPVGAIALTVVAARAVGGCFTATNITCGSCGETFVENSKQAIESDD